jgi:Flp pilus assembly protein TadG
VLVEAALVLPVVLLFLMGIIEYARYLMTVQLLNNAAQAGAVYAAKHTSPIVLGGITYGNGTSDVQNVVTSLLPGTVLSGQTVSVYMTDTAGDNLGAFSNAQAGQYVCVEIDGTYQFMVPSLLSLPASQTMAVKSIQVSEGN